MPTGLLGPGREASKGLGGEASMGPGREASMVDGLAGGREKTFQGKILEAVVIEPVGA